MKYTNWINEGILRHCSNKIKIYEVQTIEWKWTGFARCISENGEYYIGLLKDGKKHGNGT